MKQKILDVERSEYMKMNSFLWVFFYIYHILMQGIKDDRFCTVLTITLTVGGLMQLNTRMEEEKTGKPFVSDDIIQSLHLG